MAIKELKTRITLKYDSYENWSQNNPTLLAGEVAIVTIDTNNNPAADNNDHIQNPPTVLFKVGPGPFNSLQWASAKAADVHNWAKQSEAEFKTWLSTTAGFATDAEVSALIASAEARVKVTTDALAAKDAELAGKVTELENKFTGEGSVANQIEEAVAAEAALREAGDTAINNKIGTVADGKTVVTMISDAQAAASKAGTDAAAAVDTKLTNHVNTYNSKVAELAGDISDNATAIATEKSRAEGVEAGLRTDVDKIMGTGDGSFKKADAALKTELQAYADQAEADAVSAAEAYTNTRETEIKKLTSANAAEISRVAGLVSTETTERQAADEALGGRLDKVEAFFKTAEGETLDTALDSLKEIQDYLKGEGDATGGILSRVGQAETDIDNLQKEFAAGGRVTKAESDIDTLKAEMTQAKTDIDAVEASLATGGATATAIAAAKKAGDDAQAYAEGVASDLADYEEANNAALEAVRKTANAAAVKTVVDSELNTIKSNVSALQTASAKHALASDLTAVTTRVDTAESDIDAIEAIVKTGADSNTALRSAITSLQDLTGDASKGNEKLRTDLTALMNTVNNSTTGLSATKTIADRADAKSVENAAAIKAIQDDYLKAADEFIINCGTSSTNMFVKA